jgi:hypothetical protein
MPINSYTLRESVTALCIRRTLPSGRGIYCPVERYRDSIPIDDFNVLGKNEGANGSGPIVTLEFNLVSIRAPGALDGADGRHGPERDWECPASNQRGLRFQRLSYPASF